MIIAIAFAILGLCLAAAVYAWIRNDWVYKISMKMVDEIYNYNMAIIKAKHDNRPYKSYEDIPSYNYMLYKKPFKWDEKYFMAHGALSD